MTISNGKIPQCFAQQLEFQQSNRKTLITKWLRYLQFLYSSSFPKELSLKASSELVDGSVTSFSPKFETFDDTVY